MRWSANGGRRSASCPSLQRLAPAARPNLRWLGVIGGRVLGVGVTLDLPTEEDDMRYAVRLRSSTVPLSTVGCVSAGSLHGFRTQNARLRSTRPLACTRCTKTHYAAIIIPLQRIEHSPLTKLYCPPSGGIVRICRRRFLLRLKLVCQLPQQEAAETAAQARDGDMLSKIQGMVGAASPLGLAVSQIKGRLQIPLRP